MRRHFLARYAVALFSVMLALGIKLYLQQYLGAGKEQEAPFMLSMAAVMVAGWYGGFGPGLLATMLGAAIGDYYFMEPFHAFGLVTTAQKIRATMFIIEGCVVSALCQSLKTARGRAERNEAETRSLQKQVLDITDSEKRRIGHDLHDGLGQHLTGIAFMTKLLEQHLSAKSIPESGDALKIAGLVNRAIGWTRDLARGLAPVDLDQEEGLASALRQLAEGAHAMYDVPCRFERAGSSHATAAADAIHLYRIAQEALNNAIKHGQARNVVVCLTDRPRETIVTIEDDGKGFDVLSPRPLGMGLRIMRYRARMISGSLDIRTRPGGGTIVQCTYPHRAPREERSHESDAGSPARHAGGGESQSVARR